MAQSGRGSRFRRVLPFAVVGVGVYAAVAYGSSMFNSAPTHLVAQRVTPADQTIAAATGPAPAAAPVSSAVGQLGQVGSDSLPTDASAVAHNLNSDATSTVIPSTTSGSSSGASKPATGTSALPTTAASGLLGSLPLVSNLPAAGAVNNLPLQNITGSGVLPTNGTGALKNVAGLGGASLPEVNGTPLGGGLLP